MTDSVVDAAMETHVQYGTADIESHRSLTHDVIKIYGFRFKKSENGKITGKFRIEEGLRNGVALFHVPKSVLWWCIFDKVSGFYNRNVTITSGPVMRAECRIVLEHAPLILTITKKLWMKKHNLAPCQPVIGKIGTQNLLEQIIRLLHFQPGQIHKKLS